MVTIIHTESSRATVSDFLIYDMSMRERGEGLRHITIKFYQLNFQSACQQYVLAWDRNVPDTTSRNPGNFLITTVISIPNRVARKMDVLLLQTSLYCPILSVYILLIPIPSTRTI